MTTKIFSLFSLVLTAFVFAEVQTETIYLSGRDADSPVPWEFMVTGGRQADVWTKINVPSNWELEGFGAYNYGQDKNKAHEQGLYRHEFTVPGGWSEKRVFIVFDGSMTDTEVKINGKSAGPIHQGGFYRFEYDITKLLNFDGVNLLEATVSKMSSNESINFAERKSDYWVFGGIFRPVFLKAVPQEFIDWTAVDAGADGRFGMTVHLAHLHKANRLKAQIYALDGKPLGESFYATIDGDEATLTTRVRGQKNWTAETPNLYVVETTLMRDEVAIHTVRQRFGFRTIEVVDGKGIFLNGRPIVLKGCDRHSFWPSTGRALSRIRCRSDILTMKEMNMNAVRMSHYPPDACFLDLCDELGLYVLDELGGWQRPPYDTPTGKRLVWEMLKRDVNHPSILFWDNGNEGGWNTELDGEFGKWDPQNRRVLHPWELHDGVDTDHYENYQSIEKKLAAGNIFMPTEHLHGLYDGGLGAGLEDHWNLMWGHPLTGGMFLWAFADEGVVRTDKNGAIDTDGNHAPDGILGPWHEREASFYTVREIWSPVYINSNWKLPENFSGDIPVENRYDFTNLNRCRFEWRLARYYEPGEANVGHQELYRAVFPGPDLPPRHKGTISLDLPADWRRADALILSARDKNDRELFTWTWRIASEKTVSRRFVRKRGETPQVDKNALAISAGGFCFFFDENSGRLLRVRHGESLIPFGNGPLFVADRVDAETKNVKIKVLEEDGRVIVDVRRHPNFDKLTWTVYGSGWLELDYEYSHAGAVDYMGVSFDYPECRMNEIKWLGKGPYRVWKNRLKGGTVDVWRNDYKNFKVNTSWAYPEFVGYFADFNWVVFYTQDGPITIATDNDDLFLRVFSQEDGDDPRHTKMIWPDGDISFLHAIPAIGTKFKAAEELGPMGQKFQASGSYSARLCFYFAWPAVDAGE